MIDAFDMLDAVRPQQIWPRIEAAEPVENGQAVAVLVREFDGSISAVRIAVEQLAD